MEECIQSVLSLSVVNQIILVNDASTDGSFEIALQYADQYKKRVHLYNHKNQKGRSAARNTGLQHATGQWIGFLDADDYYLPHRFNLCSTKTHYDGYYSKLTTVYTDESLAKQFNESTTGLSKAIPPQELLDYLIINPDERISLNTLLVRKSVIAHVGLFDESLQVGEDTDFIWRIAAQCRLTSQDADEPVAVRRVHGQNSYFDEQLISSQRFIFYNKWLTLVREYSINSKSFDKILKSYLAYHPLVINATNPLSRWWIKKLMTRHLR